MLAIKNKHERDDHITFDEVEHKYTIDGDDNYMSVTTFIHSFFEKFDPLKVIKNMKKSKNWGPDNKYYKMTNNEIIVLWKSIADEASKLGTLMHLNIENYYNNSPFIDDFIETKEYQLFLMFLNDHKDYIAYRTEMYIYSKIYRIAGSIDIIFIDPKNKNKFIIGDWKRSKDIKFENKFQKGISCLEDIDDCNYWHYVLQLNLYRMHLEKYYDMEISEMFLIILHPNQDNYIKIIIPRISTLILKMLNIRKKSLNIK